MGQHRRETSVETCAVLLSVCLCLCSNGSSAREARQISAVAVPPSDALVDDSPEVVRSLSKESAAAQDAVRRGRYSDAFRLLQHAASAGIADAQFHLASLYRSGLGTNPDAAEAFRWMKRSAEKGHVRAQYNLATMYLA